MKWVLSRLLENKSGVFAT